MTESQKDLNLITKASQKMICTNMTKRLTLSIKELKIYLDSTPNRNILIKQLEDALWTISQLDQEVVKEMKDVK